ncbi:MAG: serine/threonine protein kinase [Candidatus Obscuribacterales bacterium]|nr:serine/threonine protein kinase [Candidatus Obscuribacterales bacterium]
MELEKGQLFQEQYRIIDVAGRGASAVVYKAFDEILRREVAIKVLVTNTGSESDLKAFLREAKILSTIEDKNVVRIFRIGLTVELYPFFVMEYLSGQTLRERLVSQAPIALGQVLEIGKAICAGMIHLESKNVLHRDLKPENILLDELHLSDSKIMDFGISKSLDDTQTLNSELVGTAAYMSPEQCRGDALNVRSDIYSFCCIIFEALCGQQVFIANTRAEILAKQLSELPDSLQIQNKDVSAKTEQSVNAFLQKGLQKDAEKRHHSFSDVLQELEKIEKSSSASTLASTFARSNNRKGSRVAPKVVRVSLFAIPLVAVALWLVAGPKHDDDNYYRSAASPEDAIKYFDQKIETLLNERNFEEANNTINSTAYSRLNLKWSKDNQRELLRDYFTLYRETATGAPGLNQQTYALAQAYFDNLLSFAGSWCISKGNEPMPKAMVEELQVVSTYLLKNTKEKKQWLSLAKIFSRNSRAFPSLNSSTFYDAAFLRFQAEEHCPGKCGDDSADYGKHCIALVRMLLSSGDLAEFQRVTEIVKKTMQRRAQLRHQLILRLITARKYASEGRIDLAEEQQKEIGELCDQFGFKHVLEYGLSNEELRAFCSMHAAMGTYYCRNKDMKKARVQLDELNKGLHALQATEALYRITNQRSSDNNMGLLGELKNIPSAELSEHGLSETYDFLQQYRLLSRERTD